MEPEGSSPCSQKPTTGPYPDLAQRISPDPRLFETFRNKLPFYGELLAPRLTPKPEDHLLSAAATVY
jgi:hypothetical protein